MTALDLPPANVRPPSFWRALKALSGKERAQHLPLLGLLALALVLAQLLILWRAPAAGNFAGTSGSSPRLALAALLCAVPVLFGLLRGFSLVLAKYLWLWVEVLVLSAIASGGLLLIAAAPPGAVFTPLGSDSLFWVTVAKLLIALAVSFAPLPAIALAAATLGHALPRHDLLAGFAAYAVLILALGFAYDLLARWQLKLPGFALFDLGQGVRPDTISGEFLLLPLLFTALLLVLAGWTALLLVLAGWLFERHAA